MENKRNLVLLYGGKSAEHEISLISAKYIFNIADKEKFHIILVGITHDGTWFLQDPIDPNGPLNIATRPENEVSLISVKDKPRLNVINQQQQLPVDVVFPVLHGTYGEDGTIQGLLRMVNAPFVGADVLSTTLCMDKDMMKRILFQSELPTCQYIPVKYSELATLDVDHIIETLQLPCFVKPANMGSSVGISKANSKQALVDAINDAFKYDQKIIIEQNIEGQEIECAVLGNDNPKASIPGEIVTHHEFYSYEAKYVDAKGADLHIPANLSKETTEKVRQLAVKAFKALDCEGMARVDFFVTPDQAIYINELNTIPGFTAISMYPKMWQATGISGEALVQQLLDLALEKFDRQQSLKTTFG